MKSAHKHMKSLAGAPDVPEHHKAAINHHAKGIAKVLKAMGAEEPADEEVTKGSKTCPDCGGKDTHDKPNPCETCGGSGRVPDTYEEKTEEQVKADHADELEQKALFAELRDNAAMLKRVSVRNGVKV